MFKNAVYVVSGEQIQGIIMRQMENAAYYLQKSRFDDSIKAECEKEALTEEYAIYPLLGLQGLFKSKERSMVADYIHDMIKHMSYDF